MSVEEKYEDGNKSSMIATIIQNVISSSTNNNKDAAIYKTENQEPYLQQDVKTRCTILVRSSSKRPFKFQKLNCEPLADFGDYLD